MAENTDNKFTPVTYISRYRQLRIVRNAAYSKEVDGRRVSVPGTSIQFEDGAFVAEDKETAEFIESRPEFGKHITKVPNNVENLAVARQEEYRSLEEREAALAAREAAVAAKEAAITDDESGKAPEGSAEGAGTDDLVGKTQKQLLEIAKNEGVEGVNTSTKVADLREAIKAHRGDSAAFED